MQNITLLTWNVAGRVEKAPLQIDLMLGYSPDLIALQEVTARTAVIFFEAFRANGYPYVVSSFDLASDQSLLKGPRRYGQFLASRYPLNPITPEIIAIPWQERVLTSEIDFGGTNVTLHITHIPPGASNKWTKIETFEGLYHRLRETAGSLRILCGDFNSPQREFGDGRVQVFGQRLTKDNQIVNERHRGQPVARWAKGEASIISGLPAIGMRDVYRTLHGYQATDYSWFHSAHKMHGRRFDHIFASNEIIATSCKYLHEARTLGLSDHSSLTAVFSLFRRGDG